MLTTVQLQALKAAILADPALAALPMTSGAAAMIAEVMNEPASPNYVVWRTDVPLEEIMRNGIDWTRVDNLSVGKARIWDWLSRLGTINASQANVRAGIEATWVGTQADLAVRAAVLGHCKRAATRAEKLLASGTGSDASPGTMTFEGALTSEDVQAARELQ